MFSIGDSVPLSHWISFLPRSQMIQEFVLTRSNILLLDVRSALGSILFAVRNN